MHRRTVSEHQMSRNDMTVMVDGGRMNDWPMMLVMACHLQWEANRTTHHVRFNPTHAKMCRVWSSAMNRAAKNEQRPRYYR